MAVDESHFVFQGDHSAGKSVHRRHDPEYRGNETCRRRNDPCDEQKEYRRNINAFSGKPGIAAVHVGRGELISGTKTLRIFNFDLLRQQLQLRRYKNQCRIRGWGLYRSESVLKMMVIFKKQLEF